MNQEKRKHLNGLSGAFQSLEWENAISFNVTIDFSSHHCQLFTCENWGCKLSSLSPG